MKWKGNRQSSNVEDRRGQRGPRMGGRGINPLLIVPLLRLIFSKTGLIIIGILLLLGLVTGINPLSFITGGGGPVTEQTSGPYRESAEEAEMLKRVEASPLPLGPRGNGSPARQIVSAH